MKKRRVRVAIIFGGRSAEHEVSVESARNVLSALDPKKYEATLIGIDKKGNWLPIPKQALLGQRGSYKALPAPGVKKELLVSTVSQETKGVDVAFPILHGPMGEDGTVQGMLKLMNLPFVGAGVLGSAVGMDKDVMKRLLNHAGIRTAKFIAVQQHQAHTISFSQVKRKLGLPFFIKPANLGSSVGISKVHSKNEFRRALRVAFQYDEKVLLEGFVKGRELECSVLGNEHPTASVPGEIICHHEFYSYEAKYLDENGADLKVPADVSKQITKKVRELSIRVFKTLGFEGMGRIDFFLTPRGKLVVNEANTIPGFTKISMYPKLWEASGISYGELIDRLIQLALARHRRDSSLKVSR